MRQDNRLKVRLSKGDFVIGTWLTIPSPAVANVICAAGFDFVIVDMEHGSASFETAEDVIRAVESEGKTPLIRVPTSDDWLILRALETGAHGIVVPQITTKEEAEQVVASVKYHPLGSRGLSPYTRSAGYSSRKARDLAGRENERTMVIVLVEGSAGISNLDKIVKTDGIDVIYLGVYDLSQSAGYPGQTDHPTVLKFMKDCISQIIEAGVSVGCLAENVKEVNSWRNAGVQLIAYQADCSLLFDACEEVLRDIDV